MEGLIFGISAGLMEGMYRMFTDTQVTTIEKSHSSPGSSKSSSEGHLRSHGPSRSQSKGSVTQAHLEEAGNAIAAAEAAVQQARFQPSNPYYFT